MKNEFGYSFTWTGDQMILHFPKNELEIMKKKANGNGSAHDCVCATAYRIWASTISSNDDDIIPFFLVVDLRSRCSMIAKDYFGNALITTNMYPEMTRKEILECDFPILVKRIREVIENVNDSMVEKQNICVMKHSKELMTLQRKKAFTMNDWRNFDRYKPKFNAKKGCVRYVSMPPSSETLYKKMWFSGLSKD